MQYYETKNIHLLIMCCDPKPIKETLKTWENYVGKIFVYANGKYAKDVKKECEEIKNCEVEIGEFLGFDHTRNLLINKAYGCGFPKIFIDDSHHLITCNKQLYIPRKYGIYSFDIIDEKSRIMYSRNLGLIEGHYRGKIHERIFSQGSRDVYKIIGAVIIDKYSFTNQLRTAKRIVKDLDLLRYHRRDDYYRFCILVKLSRFDEAFVVMRRLMKEDDEWLKLSMCWYKILVSHYNASLPQNSNCLLKK